LPKFVFLSASGSGNFASNGLMCDWQAGGRLSVMCVTLLSPH
jgi:hypothetical protein